MQLTEVLARLQGLEIYERRSVTNELAELVFENKNALVWHQQLASILGPALKSPGAKGNAEVKKLAKPFGGIRSKQSLYYKSFGDYALMAMFWPWQNGRCTTCKIHYLPNLQA